MLTDRDERILQTIRHFRYMTALDVCHALFSPRSISHVREILAKLSGGKDGQDNQYLYRFTMPKSRTGNLERIYTLGAKGRDLLRNQGYTVNWYYRPYKEVDRTFSFLYHALSMTRFCVSADFWAKQQKEVEVRNTTAYRLNEERGLSDHLLVVPDAYLVFTFGSGVFPVLLEIDCATEGQLQFKRMLAARIEFLRRAIIRNSSGRKRPMCATWSLAAVKGSGQREQMLSGAG
jgi:Replication-relaxation